MARFLKNRAYATAKINLEQMTKSYHYWISMVPTNNITRSTWVPKVSKLDCFTYVPSCRIDLFQHTYGRNDPNWKFLNMTEVAFRWEGSHVYYVEAGFINTPLPPGPHTKIHYASYGNPKGGKKDMHLKDLKSNPIVKVTWSAAFTNNVDKDFLGRTTGFEITQKDGKVGQLMMSLRAWWMV